GVRPARRDVDELSADGDLVAPGISDREQHRMAEKQRRDDKTDRSMQTVQPVASEERLDPWETADEGQLKQHARPDEQADQSAECHEATARRDTRDQATGDVPP